MSRTRSLISPVATREGPMASASIHSPAAWTRAAASRTASAAWLRANLASRYSTVGCRLRVDTTTGPVSPGQCRVGGDGPLEPIDRHQDRVCPHPRSARRSVAFGSISSKSISSSLGLPEAIPLRSMSGSSRGHSVGHRLGHPTGQNPLQPLCRKRPSRTLVVTALRPYVVTHPWIIFRVDLHDITWDTWLLLGEARSKIDRRSTVRHRCDRIRFDPSPSSSKDESGTTARFRGSPTHTGSGSGVPTVRVVPLE